MCARQRGRDGACFACVLSANARVELRSHKQAEEYTTGEEAAAKKAARSFKKYTYRGVELDQLLDLSNENFIDVSIPKGHFSSTELRPPAKIPVHRRMTFG